MNRRAGLLLVLGLFVALCVAPAAVAATPKAPIDRRITDARITESSGLAPSIWRPGVLWTHNDSGNPPKIYAIGKSGSTEATLTLTGEPDVDWEAIATLRVPSGTGAPSGPLIAVGDIGDNNSVHPNIRIAIVQEPSDLRSATVEPVRVLRLRYPDGPRDAETLLADPRTGRFFIVSKTFFGADLYAVPTGLWPGRAGSKPARVSPVTTLRKVAAIEANFLTDGAFLPDGRMLLRGYGRVYVVDRPNTVKDGLIKVLASAELPAQDQGESITPIDGGKQALIGSEGKDEPVYRISVPVVPAGAGAATLPPSSGKTVASKASSSKAESPSLSSVGSVGIWAGVAGTALVLMALTGVAVMIMNRRTY